MTAKVINFILNVTLMRLSTK